jgi:PqqD family protein of HPr-rel-A system
MSRDDPPGGRRNASFEESGRWCVATHADFAVRQWGDEYVVHHALSNDTHRLNRLAGLLLTTLRQAGAVDEDSLASACGADRETVADTLAALADLELVVWC